MRRHGSNASPARRPLCPGAVTGAMWCCWLPCLHCPLQQLDALRVPVLARSGLRGAGTPTPPRLLQKLVPCLVRMLGRTNLELLILVVTFLRKLSVFAESKNQMAACEVCAGKMP